MITLRKVNFLVFLTGWFFFPFNDFKGYSILGEYKNEACSFFFAFGFLILFMQFLKNGNFKIPINSKIFNVLLFFLLWCLCTTILNINTVWVSYFKQTGGIYRFIRQYISIIISCIIFFLYYWNVLESKKIYKLLFILRKTLFFSLIFVFVYGFLETLIQVFHITPIRYFLKLFDFFPFLDINYSGDGRISSVAYESPSLGNYLITISAWMFSYVLTSKKTFRFLPSFMVLFLAYFSGSRTALIVISVQLFLFLMVLYKMKEYRKVLLNGLVSLLLISTTFLVVNGNSILKDVDKKVESLYFFKNLKESNSNKSRLGMQYASLQVFIEHPIIGVGYGQETYYKRFKYPHWATVDNWEFKNIYNNHSITSFPSAYNIYTRFLAETGIIGISIWFYLIYLCITQSKKIFKSTLPNERIIGFILFISFVGLSLNWLQTDFLRQHGFWLCIVILIKINHERNSRVLFEKEFVKLVS